MEENNNICNLFYLWVTLRHLIALGSNLKPAGLATWTTQADIQGHSWKGDEDGWRTRKSDH